MKKSFLLLGLSMMLFACSEDDATPVATSNQPEATANKVLLLKVDALTQTFEGGKELVFPDAETFTVEYDYVLPGDFGSIALNYAEVNMPIFDGTIHWMGLGERSYPETLDTAESFATAQEPAPLPALTDFEFADYAEQVGGDTIESLEEVEAFWDAIDNLQVVKDYRESNPTAKIHLFLYTPSVGVGNPAEWDWYVILKN